MSVSVLQIKCTAKGGPRIDVIDMMHMPFDGSEGLLAVGGNPVHEDHHWRVFWWVMLFTDAACLVSQLPRETLESSSSLDLFFAVVLVHCIMQ